VSRDEREHGSRTSKTRRDVRTSESRDTIYLQVKYSAKLTLNAEIVAYSTLVLTYKHATPIRDNII